MAFSAFGQRRGPPAGIGDVRLGEGRRGYPQVMSEDLEIIAFSTQEQLWSWLGRHHTTHPGAWVRLQKASSRTASISFHELLEAGIAYGWSESTRRGYDSTSYLQKFGPRRTPGTTSDRNGAIADRLEAEGRMMPAGRRALGR